jgi:hypothetical protein
MNEEALKKDENCTFTPQTYSTIKKQNLTN